MSRVRELEEGEEILSNSSKLYHFLGVAIKEDLGSLSSRAGWILRREDGGTSKPIVTAKGRLRDGLDTSSTTLGLLEQNRCVSACFLNVRPGLPLMPGPDPC